MATRLARSGTANVNGAELYYEIRGEGPALVLIAGGASGGMVFDEIADLLADGYTVLTYDRRGLSRSPKPAGWTTTTFAEQADDCAALIRSLGLGRPAVFGHSLGGTVVVSMLERHPALVRGAIVHEPGLSQVAPSHAEFAEKFTRALAAGDLPGAARLMLTDDEMEASVVRFADMFAANQETNALELAAAAVFEPDAQALASAGVPVHAVYGEDTPAAWLVESAKWVSESSGGPLHVFPGAHGAWAGREQDFVRRLRTILASMS